MLSAQAGAGNIHRLVLRPLDALQIDALLRKLPQGAHVAQLGDMAHCELHSPVNLSLCGEATNAKPASKWGVRPEGNETMAATLPACMSAITQALDKGHSAAGSALHDHWQQRNMLHHE